jgi:hypothetical protein
MIFVFAAGLLTGFALPVLRGFPDLTSSFFSVTSIIGLMIVRQTSVYSSEIVQTFPHSTSSIPAHQPSWLCTLPSSAVSLSRVLFVRSLDANLDVVYTNSFLAALNMRSNLQRSLVGGSTTAAPTQMLVFKNSSYGNDSQDVSGFD